MSKTFNTHNPFTHKITVERKVLSENYTEGIVRINGEYFCDSIEDTVRDFTKTDGYNLNGISCVNDFMTFTSDFIKEQEKVEAFGNFVVKTKRKYDPYLTFDPKKAKVAIPHAKNVYTLGLYTNNRPIVLFIPGFNEILFHGGKNQNNSSGCIIIGRSVGKGEVSSLSEDGKTNIPLEFKERIKNISNVWSPADASDKTSKIGNDKAFLVKVPQDAFIGVDIIQEGHNYNDSDERFAKKFNGKTNKISTYEQFKKTLFVQIYHAYKLIKKIF